MDTFKCIAIAGNNGAGKTTLAEYLSCIYDLHKTSFAEKLRDICGVILGINPADLLRQEIKSAESIMKGYSNRDVLINIATAIRTMDDNYFVDATIQPRDKTVIIDDLRFEVEFDAIKKMYGDTAITILLETDKDSYSGSLMIDHDIVLKRNTGKDSQEVYTVLFDRYNIWRF